MCGAAGQNAPKVGRVPLANKVFLYRGLMQNRTTARESAERIKLLMLEDNEISRCQRWRMSHEASSERMEYQQQGLSFEEWKTGLTRGIEQLKNAFSVNDIDNPHPFNPSINGSPSLFLIVADDELANPKTDRGLARWRAENVAYHWAQLKSGEPMTRLVPHPLFNDAVDTERAAAADYFPSAARLTLSEQVEANLEETVPIDKIEEARRTGTDAYVSHLITSRKIKESMRSARN